MTISRGLWVRLRVRAVTRERLEVPRTARYSLAWDVLAGAFAGAFSGMLMPFLTKIARGELHASPHAIAIMVAAPFIGNLFSPFWARQMEGREKLPFCVYSWSAARALLFLMPFATTSNSFVAIVSLLQIVNTVATPAYTSMMRDIYPDAARGRMMGYVRVMVQSLMFVSTLITGWLLDAGVPFRYLFPVAGVFGIGAALAFAKVRPLRTARKTVADSEAVKMARPASANFLTDTLSILRHNRPYRFFALSVFVYGFANLMVQPLFGLYQVDILHISSTQIANLVNFGSLCAIGGSFFWGKFMDRHSPPTTVLCSIVLIALIPIVYLLTNRVEGLLFASALSGFGFAGIELSYLASILRYAERERTAQYQSLHSLLLGVRGVAAPLLGIPLVKAFGYPLVFLLALGVMLIGALLQWLAVRTDRAARNT